MSSKAQADQPPHANNDKQPKKLDPDEFEAALKILRDLVAQRSS